MEPPVQLQPTLEELDTSLLGKGHKGSQATQENPFQQTSGIQG